MCQLLGMNCNTPTDINFSFTGFSQRGGCTDHHSDGWGIAFFEYWLAVPANRWGSAVYSAAQLKTMQEVITLVVFAGFSVLYLKEPLGWNHALGFAFIAAGAFFIFHKWS